ncbi:MAG: ABC transporter permease subunit [Clostridia bacterium]|nr:ABC transporter permease subunit [Clostridia bacterium]
MKTSITYSNKRFLDRFLRTGAALLFWGCVWAAAAYFVDKEVLLPTPFAVGRVMVSLFAETSFWFSIFGSLVRVLIGYIAGCAVGIILAAFCFRFRLINTMFSPVLSVIRAVPVASFIILALVWIGRDRVPSFSAFLMVLPIVTGNILTGLRSVDRELWEVAKLYRFDFLKKFRLLYIPAALPHFTSAARTSLGMAWKAGIAAEVLCSLSFSIGGYIYESKVYLETPALFAWTITVILISMLIEGLLFRLSVFRIDSHEKTEVAE